MAATLLEARKLGIDYAIENAIIEEYAKSSDILMALPFDDIMGNAVSYNREDTLPGIGFRGVNEAYPESTGIVNPQTETLTIAGGDLDVDKFIIDTVGANTRSAHELMKVKALSLRWTREFFKGDNSANPRVFDGLQRRVTGTQLLNAGNTSGGDALSLMALDDAIDLVDGPTHLCMNKKMRNLLSAASRSASIGGYITFTQDQFGRRVAMYNDLPIIIADYDNDGNNILPFTEGNPGGGTPSSTSIYVMSIGDGKLTGLQNGTPKVRDLGELETKPALRTRVEWYSGFCIKHGRAVSRLQGIKNAAVVA